jgi:hypothetical protein
VGFPQKTKVWKGLNNMNMLAEPKQGDQAANTKQSAWQGQETVILDMSPQAFEAIEDGAVDDLDDLLTESVSLRAKPKASSLDDLDALLDESMQIKAEEAHVKFLRERTKRGGLTAAQAKEDEARIREWEAKREWEIKANVGVWEVRECSCGAEPETVWVGLMHFRQHREKKISSQVRATEQIASLPNMIAKQTVKVDCCKVCAGAKGWDLNGQVNFVWEIGA